MWVEKNGNKLASYKERPWSKMTVSSKASIKSKWIIQTYKETDWNVFSRKKKKKFIFKVSKRGVKEQVKHYLYLITKWDKLKKVIQIVKPIKTKWIEMKWIETNNLIWFALKSWIMTNTGESKRINYLA